jgi:hypothetical protein
MSRVAVTTQDGAHAGHFDWDKAARWSDRDVNGNGSGGAGAGEAVMLTAGGKWVLEHWTLWQGQSNRYGWITADEAHAWLLRNREDDAVEEHFGSQPEEVSLGGRPAIGSPVLVRLGELLPEVDAYAAGLGIARAEAVRRLIETGLSEEQAARAEAGRGTEA